MTTAVASPTLRERCSSIEMLVLDVDGVLTSGAIVYGASGGVAGHEIKAFHVRDGSGLKLWHAVGKRSTILTGRTSPIVVVRAAELGIHRVIQGTADKLAGLRELIERDNLDPRTICYVGDDLPDAPAMSAVGLAVAPADACCDARAVAHYITHAAGGCGAVREIIERILRCQGKWNG